MTSIIDRNYIFMSVFKVHHEALDTVLVVQKCQVMLPQCICNKTLYLTLVPMINV